MLRINSFLEFPLSTENGNGAEYAEEVLDATLGTFNDSLRIIPQHKCKLHNKMVENLWRTVNFREMKELRQPHR